MVKTPHNKKKGNPTSTHSVTSGSLTLLGGGPLPQLVSPDFSVLETFESPSARDYEITFFAAEFTSLCPVTGQPDFAEITIRYTPGRRCLESKSLKHYLGAYRNQAVFAEGIVNRILSDVVAAIAPRRALVTGNFVPRGGIGIRVEAAHVAKSPSLVNKNR